MCKKIGIIGGNGPLATAYFYELITKMTQVEREQEHIELIIYSLPSIPDRTAYITGKSKENPLPSLLKAGEMLVKNEVDLIAIPCITAHFFYDTLSAALPVPILNLPKLLADFFVKEKKKKVGIMTTEGSLRSHILGSVFHKKGLYPIYPNKETQKVIMYLIYEKLKMGKPIDFKAFNSIRESFSLQQVDCILLGCTDLSLIKKEMELNDFFVDPLVILAKEIIKACEKELSPYN